MEKNSKQSAFVVDGDQEFPKAMEKMLEKTGYAIAVARDGQVVLDVLSKETSDLITSPLRLPNLSGIELMEEIGRKKGRVGSFSHRSW